MVHITQNEYLRYIELKAENEKLQAEIQFQNGKINFRDSQLNKERDVNRKLSVENEKLKKLLDKHIPKHSHDHDYWHDDCYLCQNDKAFYNKAMKEGE